MKNMGLALIVAFCSPAFASHFMSCDVEAEVVEVTDLARLDGSATFRQGMGNHEQTVVLKVTAIAPTAQTRLPGRCLPVGHETTLHVKQDQVGKYTKGQELKLHYNNVGDRLGSRITWTVQ